MWELDATAAWNGFTTRRLLPVLGCDPGPTRRMFPRFREEPLAAAVTVKTGTLTTTDGGVAVLAGHFLSPTVGEVVFCVAAPEAGGAIDRWRRLEQEWLVDLISSVGGAVASPCGGTLPLSDTLVEIEVVVGPDE
jgi:D-alanyl-D-alanine carboxypeptidase